MEFITNQKTKNHLDHINELIKDSDEIFISVAFLKMSGLHVILSALKKAYKEKKKIVIVTGQYFGITEPNALKVLLDLSNKNEKAKLFLFNAKKDSPVFHPKLYIFKKAKKYTIISGSANLTAGGLQTNTECSIMIEAKKEDTFLKDVFSFFKEITNNDNSVHLNSYHLRKYTDYHKKQKIRTKNSKAIPDTEPLDFKALKKRIKKYKTAKSREEFLDKETHYIEAKEILDDLLSTKRLTRQYFEDSLEALAGYRGYWHSGSLFRLRKKIYPYFKEFRDLVKFIKENKNKSAEFVFENARNMVSEIDGAGVNYITEIMMTYNPDKFANMNSNPLTVLTKEANLDIKKHSSSYKGIDYEEYCNIIGDINNELGLKNMLESDSFFNSIYWKIKEERKLFETTIK